ncbi:MAG: hypothetical protein HDQ88_08835 [Clostridia bacterium]|nr:hypothetical protein [Clostridia bacterium]
MKLSVICKVPRELTLERKSEDRETIVLGMSDGSHFEIEHVTKPGQPDFYNGAWLQPSKYRNAPDEVCEAFSTHDKNKLEDWLSDVMSRIPCHPVNVS